MTILTGGNVGIGDTTPASLFTVGSGDLFQVNSSGALVAGSIASGFGTIATANTITGTTLNGTTGINTGAAAGTQRIDASGNLVNIGTITSGLINGQTISSAANFTGTLAVATDTTLTGDLAVNGGDMTTTQATFNLLNATATTVNAFGAATAINVGAAAGATITPGGNLTFAQGATKGIALQSSLASAGRTTATLTLTQANDVTNDASSTGYLLDVQQLDTGTAIAAVNINNASTTTGAAALNISNSNTSTTGPGITVTGVASGRGINVAGITSGIGISNTAITTGSAINLGTATTSGNGLLFNTNGHGLTSGKALNVTGAASAITDDYTGSYISVTPTRTLTAAATRTESGNWLNLARANVTNGASSIMNITGDLSTLSSTCTQTLGTCTDTSNILQLTQSYATASGEVLRVDGAGTGNLATLDATAATANGVLIDVHQAVRRNMH